MEKLYKRLLEFTGDGVYRYKLSDGTVLLANRGFVDILDLACPPEQLVGRKLRELMVYVEPEGLIRAKLEQHGEIRDDEYHFRTLSGKDRWVVHDALLTTDLATGEPVVETIIRDITFGKQAEEKLQKLNRQFRAISLCNQMLVQSADEDALLRAVCKIIVEEAGYRMACVGLAESDEAKTVRPAAFAGHEDGFLQTVKVTAADTERGHGPAGTAVRTGKTCVCNDLAADPLYLPWRAEALKRGYASCIGLPLLSDGQTIGVLAIYSGTAGEFAEEEVELLTELSGDLAYGIAALRARAQQKRAEQLLRLSEERMRFAMEVAHMGEWTTDLPDYSGHHSLLHDRIFGYATPVPEWTYDKFMQHVLPEDRPRVVAATQQQADEARPDWQFECRIVRVDGEIRWINSVGRQIVDASGQVRRIAGVIQDITERKQAEEESRRKERAVQESSARLNFALEASQIGYWDLDLIDHTASRSPRHARIFGYESPLPDWSYETFMQHVMPEDRAMVDARFKAAVASQGHFSFECRIIRVDGAARWIFAAGRHSLDAAGQPRRMSGIVQDITERKQAEQEVRQLNAELEQRVKQRTAMYEFANKELEAFSYSVAHDLRAPLRAIDGFSRILAEDYRSALPAEAQRYLKLVCDQVTRMSRLIDDLLALSRVGRQPLNRRMVQPGEIVQQVLSELAAERHGRNVELRLGSLPACSADPGLLKQVYVNLLANALKFSRKRDPAIVEVGAEQQSGEQVFFVRDNGVGFDMRYADKLFGVFQRLHRTEDYEGTGIGLATVQRIIHRHGGRVWAQAQPDSGATFYFTLS